MPQYARSSLTRWLFVLIACTAVGALAGYLYHRLQPTEFKSETYFKVERRDPIYMGSLLPFKGYKWDDMQPFRHELAIVNRTIVNRCVQEIRAKNLPFLENVTEDQQFQTIARRLDCRQNPEEYILFELHYHSLDPMEGQVFLNQLLSTYRNFVEPKVAEDENIELAVEATMKIFEGDDKLQREYLASYLSKQSPAFNFVILQNPTVGTPVSPFPRIMFGAGVGCLLGLLTLLFPKVARTTLNPNPKA